MQALSNYASVLGTARHGSDSRNLLKALSTGEIKECKTCNNAKVR